MKLEDLSPEQIEKAKACKSGEELAALAKKLGYELSDEELESIGGGVDWKKANCPGDDCESHDSCPLRY